MHEAKTMDRWAAEAARIRRDYDPDLFKLSEAEIRVYAGAYGSEAAHDFILLAGPDGIVGGWEAYSRLEAEYK